MKIEDKAKKWVAGLALTGSLLGGGCVLQNTPSALRPEGAVMKRVPLPDAQDGRFSGAANPSLQEVSSQDFSPQTPGFHLHYSDPEKGSATDALLNAISVRNERAALKALKDGADTQIVIAQGDGAYTTLAGNAAAYGMPGLLHELARTGREQEKDIGGFNVCLPGEGNRGGNALHNVAGLRSVQLDTAAFDEVKHSHKIPLSDRNAALDALIQRNPTLLWEVNDDGLTPLETAIKKHNTDMVQFFASNPKYLNASLQTPGRTKETLLKFAQEHAADSANFSTSVMVGTFSQVKAVLAQKHAAQTICGTLEKALNAPSHYRPASYQSSSPGGTSR